MQAVLSIDFILFSVWTSVGLKLETAAEAAAFLLPDVGDEAGVGGSDWIRHRLTSSWILLVAVRSVGPWPLAPEEDRNI